MQHDYSEQVSRIKHKLFVASATDHARKVFGAQHHNYELGPPVSRSEIAEFEARYRTTVPECYATFITEVGNGGRKPDLAGAGPYYGIIPFGRVTGTLIEKPAISLALLPRIYPGMSNEVWQDIIRRVEEDEDISDEAYDEEVATIYGGILPIGSQGCTYLHGLVLRGAHQGMIVNLDLDLGKPHFAFEANFLDWYERWLDEIISGELLKQGPHWFGYVMAGSEALLKSRYRASQADWYRTECLRGMYRFPELSQDTIDVIEEACDSRSPTVGEVALALLAKHDYARARPRLKRNFRVSATKTFECVRIFAKEYANDWQDEIKQVLAGDTIEKQLLWEASSLIELCHDDLSFLIEKFVHSNDEIIRRNTEYLYNKLRNRQK